MKNAIDPFSCNKSRPHAGTRYLSFSLAMMLIALLLMVTVAQAQPSGSDALAPGRRAISPEVFLRTGDAVALCLKPEDSWKQFCDGLLRGYAEYAVLSGKACIPFGTSHRDLVSAFTAPQIVVSTGYIDDWPALETALEVFIQRFPCR